MDLLLKAVEGWVDFELKNEMIGEMFRWQRSEIVLAVFSKAESAMEWFLPEYDDDNKYWGDTIERRNLVYAIEESVESLYHDLDEHEVNGAVRNVFWTVTTWPSWYPTYQDEIEEMDAEFMNGLES